MKNVLIKIFLVLLFFCKSIFAIEEDKEKFIIDAISLLSQETLCDTNVEVDYVVNVNSEEYAEYLSALTKTPKKDIHYINESLQCNLVFDKDGKYSLREVKSNNKNDWCLNIYDGKEYFRYAVADKRGQISSEKPNIIVPTYLDYMTKVPQVVNISKFWDSYKTIIPNSKDISLKTSENGVVMLSFLAGKRFYQIDMVKNFRCMVIKELRVFDTKTDDKNFLIVKVSFGDYRDFGNKNAPFPHSIDVEYYTVAGMLLCNDSQFELPRRLERKDSIRVNKINIGSNIDKSVDIPKDSVIHDFNTGKTIYLNEIFD